MNRGKVLTLSKSGFINYIYKNKGLFLLSLFYLLGLIFGVLLIRKNNITYNFSELIFKEYILNRTNTTFISVFLSSFFTMFVFVFFVFLSGTSFVGVVLSPILILAFGYLNGAFLSYVYIQNSIKGIAFNAVIIIPTAILFIIGLLLSAKESLGFSTELIKLTFYKGYASSKIFELFKNYCVKYALLLFLSIAAALFDGIFSVSFIKYFNF